MRGIHFLSRAMGAFFRGIRQSLERQVATGILRRKHFQTGVELDARAGLHAAGVVLYQMLVGHGMTGDGCRNASLRRTFANCESGAVPIFLIQRKEESL